MLWPLAFGAIAILIIGLVGQAFEMRKIRLSTYRDEELASSNVFLNRRNFKWYGLIIAALILWYVAQSLPQ